MATAFLTGCGGQDTPVEQAEEEAGVEEIVEEETTRDIAAEGCPEGQVSNAAGTECRDEDAVREAHAPDMSDPDNWRTQVDYTMCERLMQDRGPMANERYAKANEPEREKMCRQVLDLPSKEIEEKAIETAKAQPEKDWSKGYTPWPDGSIRPAAEVEAEMDEAVDKATEKMKSR